MTRWSASEWIAFFGALATVVGSIAAATVKILDKVREIHLSINSRVDELVAETRKAAMAEGRQTERGLNPPATIINYPPITESMGIKPPAEKP